ncbi:MAG: T9SS type A sorting domain-containing protein [Candidatus Tenebribacter burtonii]|nr:T9SS type A sorting domain-containing protein [Candidatus Tenebribacter burtonii]
MKYKILFFVFTFILFVYIIFILSPNLSAEPTFINSYPYQDLFPPDFTFGDSHCCNIIEAVDGGFILEAFINANWDIAWYPQAMFFKIAENGDLEWRKTLWDEEWDGPYFNSFISNGVDKYYGVGDYFGGPTFFYVFDDSCNVISQRILGEEISLNVEINSIKLLDDGIVLVGKTSFNNSSLLIKTDFNGNIIWYNEYQYEYNGILGSSELNSVIVTNDNGYLACGFGHISNPNTTEGIIIKYNSLGDTLWTSNDINYYYTSLLEYENEDYYLMSHNYLLHYNNNGNLINEYLLLNIGTSYQSKSSILKLNDNNLILLYNTTEGEIHKLTTTGEILWQQNHLDDNENPAYISMCENSIVQIYNNDIVYGGTIENYDEPEIILIRTDPEGNVPVTIETITQYSKVIISNYPNPFNSETNIVFNIPEEGFIKLKIYNIRGQKVRSLVNEILQTGEYIVFWDGKNDSLIELGSGVYMVSLKTNSFVNLRKILLIK